jgi:hypothetical protein
MCVAQKPEKHVRFQDVENEPEIEYYESQTEYLEILTVVLLSMVFIMMLYTAGEPSTPYIDML